MGKKRIEALLTNLKETQERDLMNSAQIYTVAQVAVNELAARDSVERALSSRPTLPEVPHYSIADLKAQYPNVSACRKALKEKGLTFSKTPSWAKMAIALHHFEIQQQQLQSYLQHCAGQDLAGTVMTFRA